jgi:hypothetical protein
MIGKLGIKDMFHGDIHNQQDLHLGVPYAPVLSNFVNLIKLLNEFLLGKLHKYLSEEAKRKARACHVP